MQPAPTVVKRAIFNVFATANVQFKQVANVVKHFASLKPESTGKITPLMMSISALETSAWKRTISVHINDTEVPVVIDSGASVNILDGMAFQRLHSISLAKTDLRVYPYGSPKPIPVKGIFNMRVYSGSTGLSTEGQFGVVENDNAGSLLGKDTAIALGQLRVGPVEPVEVRSLTQISPRTEGATCSSHMDQLVTQHASIFEGVGKLKNCQLKIHTDPKVTPVAQPLSQTPFHM